MTATGDLLSGPARRNPDRPALVVGDRTWSYGALDRRANQAAGVLRVVGVTKGDRVALYAPNSGAWVEIFFGAARLGAVLVPVSARLRAAEVADLLRRSDASVLVFDSHLQGEVQQLRDGMPWAPRFVEVGAGGDSALWAVDYEDAADAAEDTDPGVDVGLTDLHSICFTAGTTGAPKGAMLTHANVVVGTHEMSVRNFGYTEADVFLNVTSLAHRAGWARLIQSIGIGAVEVLTPRFDPEETLRLIERHRVTLVGLVPTMIRLIDQAAVADRFDLSSLRTIIATAEACPLAVRRRVFELFPGGELMGLFASTEAGQIAVLASEDQLRQPTATGRPLEGVELRIVDDDGHVLPAGEVGEIAVRTGAPGTSGVMLGYLGDDADDGGFEDGWFRTGDCGCLDADGFLHVLDRKKDMILSGGLNVSSREVEQVLLRHPGVADAVVIGVSDPTWGESVAAVVVRGAGREVTEEELIAHCRAGLASYKKPRQVRFVDALPRNAAGKVMKYRVRDEWGRAGSA